MKDQMPIPLTLNGREHQGFMKQHDMFGHPIGFNFEGYDTHNTAFGGCCSILIKIAISVYVFLNCKKLIFAEDDTVVTQVFYQEMADEPQISHKDTGVLIFWSIQHSAGHLKPIFLDDEDINSYVKFDYVQQNLNFNVNLPDGHIPFVRGKVK